MARFILDVATEDIQKVLDILDRDNFLGSSLSAIYCIDETNENQFYAPDSIANEDGTTTEYNYIDNQLSTKQVENFKQLLEGYSK